MFVTLIKLYSGLFLSVRWSQFWFRVHISSWIQSVMSVLWLFPINFTGKFFSVFIHFHHLLSTQIMHDLHWWWKQLYLYLEQGIVHVQNSTALLLLPVQKISNNERKIQLHSFSGRSNANFAYYDLSSIKLNLHRRYWNFWQRRSVFYSLDCINGSRWNLGIQSRRTNDGTFLQQPQIGTKILCFSARLVFLQDSANFFELADETTYDNVFWAVYHRREAAQ